MTAQLRLGHVLDVLRAMPAESVRCCITSPPYWGLRNYGTPPQVWGGDSSCEHDWQHTNYTNHTSKGGQGAASARAGRANVSGQERLQVTAGTCSKCGAWLGHLGLEDSPQLYVQHIVQVFREVRRVLANDGTLWLNMGDCYASKSCEPHNAKGDFINGTGDGAGMASWSGRGQSTMNTVAGGLKLKDLVMMPGRVALALQDDGWWIRSDIVWAKENPMPESVYDRPTRAHEYIFLCSKSRRYYYDADAIAEPLQGSKASWKTPDGWDTSSGAGGHGSFHKDGREKGHRKTSGNLERNRGGEEERGITSDIGRNIPWDAPANLKRNARTVWVMNTQPYKGAHFATFPDELPRRCILAGSAPGDTVLDPFGGSGTTAAVAVGNGRAAVHIDLNPEYLELARQRIGPMLCTDEVA